MESATMNHTITIMSIDGRHFTINKEVLKLSGIFNDMFEIEFTDNNDVCPLLNMDCTSDIMEQIFQFMEYIYNNKDDAEQLQTWIDNKGKGNLPRWLFNFINVEKSVIFKYTIVADFLNIQILSDFCCATIANIIKNLQPDEVKIVFN